MKEIHVVAGVFEREGKVLIFRRKPGSKMAGKWEFPGGKIEPGEHPEEALKRELREELNVDVKIESFIGTSVHDYPEFRIHLAAYLVSSQEQVEQSIDHDKMEWITPSDYENYDIAEADIPLFGWL